MMTRYSIRFWGILESVSALAHLKRQHENGKILDKPQAAIEALQNLSLLFYYGMEHYCYIDYTAPGTFDAATVGKCERVSCGAWFVWILLELMAILKQYQELSTMKKLTAGMFRHKYVMSTVHEKRSCVWLDVAEKFHRTLDPSVSRLLAACSPLPRCQARPCAPHSAHAV